MMKAIVLIPAAGKGSRMGSVQNKQYLDLAGKPILAHTLALFDYHPLVEQIYLIVPQGDIDYCREKIVTAYGFDKVSRILAGGEERQDSVFNGLLAMAEDGHDQPERPVLIHDGARPLFNNHLLSQLIEIIAQRGACAVGVPVKDTIKDVENLRIAGSPERQRLWQAQTPQGAQYGLLHKAFLQAISDNFRGTDDAALLTRMGYPVHMLESDYRNIKVTTPEDLLIAAALLDSGKDKTA